MRRSPTACSATPSITTTRTAICAVIRARRWCRRSSPWASTRMHPVAMRSRAYTIGLEVAGKLGRAFGDGHYLRGWHATATVGVFAATAAAAPSARAFGRAAAPCVWASPPRKSSGSAAQLRHHDQAVPRRPCGEGTACSPRCWRNRASPRTPRFSTARTGSCPHTAAADGQAAGRIARSSRATLGDDQAGYLLQTLALLLLQPPVDRRPAPDDPRTRPDARRDRGDRDRFSAGFRYRTDRERSAHRAAGQVQHRVRRRRDPARRQGHAGKLSPTRW